MIRLCAFADEYGNSFDEQVEGLKKNHIDLIELRNIDGRNVSELSEKEADEYYRRFSAEGISVWSLGSPLGKVKLDADMDEYMKTVEHTCLVAKRLHAKRIRMFSFFDAYEKKEYVFSLLRRMVEIADKHGVTLCHENEKEIYGDTLERVLEIHGNVPGLSLIYDPANFLQVGEDAEKTLDALIEKTAYFHVKDLLKSTGQIVAAGQGDGRIGEILTKIDGDLTFTIEPHLALFEGYAKIDASELKTKTEFKDNHESFDFAVGAFKSLLAENGYFETGYNNYERKI